MSDFPEGYFYIRSRQNGKVIDAHSFAQVDGGYTKNDTKILIWTPKHTDDRDNQLWYYQDGFIVNKNSNKVLDVRGGALHDNTPVIQYDRKLVVDAQNQRWGYKSRDGVIYLLADPRMVLDIRGDSADDGAKVILYHRKSASEDNLNQNWDLVNEVYCEGPLLKTIQPASLYPNSETFVEKPTSKPVDQVLAAFGEVRESSH
ncbi:ricin B lectin domain-containing protein [Zychaea mexicana]|uniref:ricin B lectin domain-containing protein n=1 Tax=Zychaea mexicana TaxID=64656 RepID=UPI0022FDBBE1|nr:ricin B lectin domain-containing protein [Zychaea mexicana]KAI9489883.1 ricin B lectin domain-containing protein [Zychaea mexicana]